MLYFVRLLATRRTTYRSRTRHAVRFQRDTIAVFRNAFSQRFKIRHRKSIQTPFGTSRESQGSCFTKDGPRRCFDLRARDFTSRRRCIIARSSRSRRLPHAKVIGKCQAAHSKAVKPDVIPNSSRHEDMHSVDEIICGRCTKDL